MKVTLQPSDEITALRVEGNTVHARLWTGETEDGVLVKAYITAISPQTHDVEVNAQFERELRALDTRQSLYAIDIRFIL